jgi:hypothetical protein
LDTIARSLEWVKHKACPPHKTSQRLRSTQCEQGD